MHRFALACFFPLLAAFFAACGSETFLDHFATSTQQLQKPTFSIYNINLLDGDNQGQRLVNMASLFHTLQERRYLSRGLFALNECHAKSVRPYPGGPKTYEERKLWCPTMGAESLSTHCLAEGIQDSAGARGPWYQKGEIGFIVDDERFELLSVHKKRIGSAVINTTRRRVVGVRLRIRGTNHVLPFFSTHINTATSWFRYRKQQVKQMTQHIQSWVRPGDLPPVVAGDFNSSKTSSNGDDRKLWDVTAECYDEVGAQLTGAYAIEQIWIGKRDCFPGSTTNAHIMPVRYEFLDEFRDSAQYSDHAVPYAELEIQGI